MPVTRRRRANPPEQPENNNNNHVSEQAEPSVEAASAEQQVESAATVENTAPSDAPPPPQQEAAPEETAFQSMLPPSVMPPPFANGERGYGRPDYNQTIEGGRRTARGELFRRPPQAPVPAPAPTPVPVPAVVQPPVPEEKKASVPQAPSHEIKLPLGMKPGDTAGDPLHLAYNPGYTGSDEVRSALLRRLAVETKHGGRARCWGCGSLAVAYECWNTRSKTFGEIGVAYCEICGVWSVM